MKLGLKRSGRDLKTLERERLANESDQVGTLGSQTCPHRGNGQSAGWPFREKCDGLGKRRNAIIIRARRHEQDEVGTTDVRLEQVGIRSRFFCHERASARIAFVIFLLLGAAWTTGARGL